MVGCFSGLPLNPLFVLDLSLNTFNRIGGLYIKRDSFPCQSLDENLHLQKGGRMAESYWKF